MMAERPGCNLKQGFQVSRYDAAVAWRKEAPAPVSFPRTLGNSDPLEAFKSTRGGSHLHGDLRLPLVIKAHAPTLSIFAGKCKSTGT
jgi:hypothetical protein